MTTLVREPVLYPNLHLWFVLLASLDVLITAAVLKLGGHEINPIAASIIETSAHTGMTFFKFATVAFVLIACEFIGRSSSTKGRTIAAAAVIANSFAITVGSVQLAIFFLAPTL